MALTVSAIQAQLEASKFVGPLAFNGVTFPKLALAIAQAVTLWGVGVAGNLALTGTSTGTTGTGTVTGNQLTVVPNNGLIEEALRANNINGQLVSSLAMALTVGIAQAFSFNALYVGTSSGVGVGIDTSVIAISNPITLTALMLAQLNLVVGKGQATASLAAGLGQGIAAMLLGSVGTGNVTGPPSPVGATGVTFSVVI